MPFALKVWRTRTIACVRYVLRLALRTAHCTLHITFLLVSAAAVQGQTAYAKLSSNAEQRIIS